MVYQRIKLLSSEALHLLHLARFIFKFLIESN